MRGEQAIFNLDIKKKSGLSLNPDIHHSKVFSSLYTTHNLVGFDNAIITSSWLMLKNNS